MLQYSARSESSTNLSRSKTSSGMLLSLCQVCIVLVWFVLFFAVSNETNFLKQGPLESVAEAFKRNTKVLRRRVLKEELLCP